MVDVGVVVDVFDVVCVDEVGCGWEVVEVGDVMDEDCIVDDGVLDVVKVGCCVMMEIDIVVVSYMDVVIVWLR